MNIIFAMIKKQRFLFKFQALETIARRGSMMGFLTDP